MKQYENDTREELRAIINELERKVEILSSSHATSPEKCFRKKDATQILDALPDMLTVLDHNANIVELVSSPMLTLLREIPKCLSIFPVNYSIYF